MAKETTKTPKAEDEGPRSFAVFLTHLSEGEAERELSRQMQALMKQMRDEAIARNGKIKGALAVNFKFIIPPTGPVAVTYDVTSKAPKRVTSEGYFWLTKGGNLTHKNPKQEELPLREVSEPSAREIPDDEPAAAPREA